MPGNDSRQANAHGPPPEPAEDETSNHDQPVELDQVIERFGARYTTELRRLRHTLRGRVQPGERERGAATAAGSGRPPAQDVRATRPATGPARRSDPVQAVPPRAARSRGMLRIRLMLLMLLVLLPVLGSALFTIGQGRQAAPGTAPAVAATGVPAAPTATAAVVLPPTTVAVPTATAVAAPTPDTTVMVRATPGSLAPALPTPVPSPSATPVAPTATPPSAVVVRQQVIAAEVALRTGWFEAIIDLGNGNRAAADVRFDRGDAQHVSRLQITTTYQGATDTQTHEYLRIGESMWQRQADGQWAAIATREGLWEQVLAFLPHAAAVPAADVQLVAAPSAPPDGRDAAVEIRWQDAQRAAEVTLSVDPMTGIPRQLRQVSRATGVALTVTYRGWNTPVDIVPPPLP